MFLMKMIEKLSNVDHIVGSIGQDLNLENSQIEENSDTSIEEKNAVTLSMNDDIMISDHV